MAQSESLKAAANSGAKWSLRRTLSPLVVSLILGCLYALICSVYIWLSGIVALHYSQSATQLASLEMIKGFLFVFVTAVAIFGGSYTLLCRLKKREDEILRNRAAILASERRALAGIFAASIAHDINNILSIIESAVNLLSIRGSVVEKDQGVLRTMNDAADRAADLARRLMQIGREGIPGQVGEFDFAEVIQSTLEFTHQHTRVRDCTLKSEMKSTPFVGNRSAVEQMLFNLIINAADATSGRGTIEIRLLGEDYGVAIEVHDNGPGVAKGKRDEIFDPFFSTKAEGIGLGLLSVTACAQLHSGRVSVSDSPLGGACFRVELHRLKAIPPNSSPSAL